MMSSILLSLVFACGEKKTEVEVATPPAAPVEEVVDAPVEEPVEDPCRNQSPNPSPTQTSMPRLHFLTEQPNQDM